MQKSINIPLRSLNPIMVKDLQQQYPTASLHIELSEDDSPQSKMDDEVFWKIIAHLDWGRKDTENILVPAVAVLSSYPIEQIYQFEQILADKLSALDGEKYAVNIGWGKKESDHFSPDAFLYARCCAVANGKKFYEQVLNAPTEFPKEYTFEPILYLAEKAYQQKTGNNDYDFLPNISYETFSNDLGWPYLPSLPNLLSGKTK